MNMQNTTSIRANFVLSKVLFPALGSLVLATQVGCVGIHKHAEITRGAWSHTSNFTYDTNHSSSLTRPFDASRQSFSRQSNNSYMNNVEKFLKNHNKANDNQPVKFEQASLKDK